MSDVSLYRKWRPVTLSQFSGQEPVVRTLGAAIDSGRLAHAYLFSGPRGTGKTSMAKVLAMGVNCYDGPTREPCGECGSCRAIIRGSSVDVLEMDAASNRRVDEMRDVLDKANLAPTKGSRKVYIVDEVHMLIQESFNALLKTLEEPPPGVMFILATTEKHKVLPTIVSRCQCFEFRRPGVREIAGKLQEMARVEGIEAEPEALAVIARAGGGSFRDAEGLLDQLSSFSEGVITASGVEDMLGSAGSEVLGEAVEALHERRTGDALRLLDRLASEGRELPQFAKELVEYLRRVLLVRHAPESAFLEVGEGEERERLRELAEGVPEPEVTRIVDALGEALGRAKRSGAAEARLEIELAFVRLTRDYVDPPVEKLTARLEAAEAAIGQGVPAGRAASYGAEPSGNGRGSPSSSSPDGRKGGKRDESAEPVLRKGSAEGAAEDETAGETDAGEADIEAEPPVGAGAEPLANGEFEAGVEPSSDPGWLASQWPSVVEELQGRRQALTAAIFKEAEVESLSEGVLRLSFAGAESFYVTKAGERRHTEELGKVLERRLGERPRIEIFTGDEDSPRSVESSDSRQGGAAEPSGSGDSQGSVRKEASGEHRGLSEQDSEDSSAAMSEGDTESGQGVDVVRDEQEVREMARRRFGRAEVGSAEVGSAEGGV